MIRLAEAMARMEISDEVKPKHVNEAYRLLNKSIIRVEQPDIYFQEDDNVPMAVDDQDNEENQQQEKDNENTGKRKLVLSFDEYKNLSNMIVVYMRREEARMEEGNKGKLTFIQIPIICFFLFNVS